MTSIVADILSSAGILEREELGSKITAFSKRIADVKLQVHQNLQTRYVDFLPVAIYTSELDKRVTSCYDEMKFLDDLIQKELLGHVQETAGEFEGVSNQLAVAKTALSVVRTVVAFHEALERSNAEAKLKDYPESVNYLLRARHLLRDLKSSWEEGQIHTLQSLECDCTVHAEKLTYDLRELWNEHLRWTEVKKEGDGGATVRFTVGGGDEFDLQGVARAMNLLGYLDVPLKVLAGKLRTHLLYPVVTEPAATVTSSVEGAVHVLTLDVNPAEKKKKGDSRPRPSRVFAGLSAIIDFAGAVFGPIRLSDDEPESEKGVIRGGGLARRLGDAIYDDLCRLLITECLSPAVPTARCDLGSFDRVVKLTVDFQARLVALGFVPTEQTALLNYAQNVDALFADKACREIVARARRVMLKELYDSIPAPAASSNRDDVKVSVRKLEADSMETFIFDEKSSLPEDTTHAKFDRIFSFPACFLSKSATEFVEILHEVLEEASSSSPLCSGRLFETAQNIVELYCTVVPCYHRDNLDAFPQQSALLHNNCMYIAHHLLTIGHQYKGKLALSGSDEMVTFVDQVPRVREIGIRAFLSQMQLQKKQLLTVLGEVGGFHKLYVSDTFFTPLSRAIKKCMLQLEHLKKVWQGVLPFGVYCKAIGTLANSLIEEIICQTVQLEDLSADSAGHFIEIFGLIKEAAPLLFKAAESEESTKIEIHRRVLKWAKFLELLFLLDANLQSILDRWAGGKGPLAHEFSTDEVKKIIRALFQNTDHRASVLAKIK